jgi:hypothetical protein
LKNLDRHRDAASIRGFSRELLGASPFFNTLLGDALQVRGADDVEDGQSQVASRRRPG